MGPEQVLGRCHGSHGRHSVAGPACLGVRARSNALGVLFILTVTAVASWPLLIGGTVIGQDAATQSYPWHAYLGEHLRTGDIPGWSPSLFSGAPFAADPQSGWMYLPAMALFTLLPLATAVKAFMFAHLALAGLATFGLARVLGMPLGGALVAASAFELSWSLYGRVACCPASTQIIAWTPLVLLCAELAVTRRSWSARTCWWGVTGLALSQVVSAWLGQGAYYVVLVLVSYIVYRTLLAPPAPSPSMGARLAWLMLHGGAILLFGVTLAAAGILPRLEYNALSNLAGGAYQGDQAWAATVGGWTPAWIATWLLDHLLIDPVAAVLPLAFLAMLLAMRNQFAAPYFLFLGLAGLILALDTRTPLHVILYAVLPRFETLHQHWPERIIWIAYLSPALLAGATVSVLARRRHGRVLLTLLVCLLSAPMVATLRRHAAGDHISHLTAFTAAFALALSDPWPALPLVRRCRPRLRQLLPVVLLTLFVANLLVAGRSVIERGQFAKVDLNEYYGSAGAASFLQSKQTEAPFRFFGYDPQLQTTVDGQSVFYRNEFRDPRTRALLVNNQAALFGLQDLQGYNPVQLARYVEFMTALNGSSQDYHGANVLASGLDSPLLNLLNARYIVIPATIPPDRADLRWLVSRHPIVYADAQVKVLENRQAMPRAWIVHTAYQVPHGDILGQLAAGAVDPQHTALLEEPPPILSPPGNIANDQVSIMAYSGDSMRVSTYTDVPSLLVLSEAAYPGWRATVDGTEVRLYVVDSLLRGVPVPAGAHTVELRYESRSLQAGVMVSLAACAVLVISIAAALRPRWSFTRWSFARHGR